MIKIDKWYTGERIHRADCFFYPEKGIYAGNVYNKAGKIIGDYWSDNSVEIEKRFPGIFGTTMRA